MGSQNKKWPQLAAWTIKSKGMRRSITGHKIWNELNRGQDKAKHTQLLVVRLSLIWMSVRCLLYASFGVAHTQIEKYPLPNLLNICQRIWAIKQWQKIPNISKAEHRWATRCLAACTLYALHLTVHNDPARRCEEDSETFSAICTFEKYMTHFMFLTVNWFLQISWAHRKWDCKRINILQ